MFWRATVRHGGGGLVIWARFDAIGAEHLAVKCALVF